MQNMKDLWSRVTKATGEQHAKSFLFESLSMNQERVTRSVAHHRKLEDIYNLGTILIQEN